MAIRSGTFIRRDFYHRDIPGGGLRITGALVPVQTALANIRTFGPQAQIAQDFLTKARAQQGQKQDSKPVGQGGTKTSQVGPSSGFTVAIRDVTFTHRNGSTAAIRRVSLDIPWGAFVALVGPSGAGKTTLADIILGIRSPDSGHVAIEGFSPADIRIMSPGQIACVPQTPGMVAGSIAENVALGTPKKEIDEKQVWEALKLAEPDRVVSSLPDGIQSSFGK